MDGASLFVYAIIFLWLIGFGVSIYASRGVSGVKSWERYKGREYEGKSVSECIRIDLMKLSDDGFLDEYKKFNSMGDIGCVDTYGVKWLDMHRIWDQTKIERSNISILSKKIQDMSNLTFINERRKFYEKYGFPRSNDTSIIEEYGVRGGTIHRIFQKEGLIRNLK